MVFDLDSIQIEWDLVGFNQQIYALSIRFNGDNWYIQQTRHFIGNFIHLDLIEVAVITMGIHIIGSLIINNCFNSHKW